MLQNERMQKRTHLYSVKKQCKRVFLHPLEKYYTLVENMEQSTTLVAKFS